jgi:predicted dehydrogenase
MTTKHDDRDWTRREMIGTSGRVMAATALAGVAIPRVHAAEDNTLQVALVGCGGRGTGAAANALSTKSGNTKLVAMADVFPDKLKASYAALTNRFDEKKIDVPEERKFIGFEGYKDVMNYLRPGDVVILTTPPAFRWVHFTYAIERGLNVFMEKPITVDGPGTRKMLQLGEESMKKNLKVGVGLMCRHCNARRELFDRIQDGQIGDVILLRAYRVAGPTGSAFVKPRPADMPSELLYQIRSFHGFLWLSGGAFSDFMIHNIDESCWMKNAWPVKAKAFGGRHYRGDHVDQNFDSYSVEYTFADGALLLVEGRYIPGCYNEFASYAQGAKGSAIISTASHTPARSRIYKGQDMTKRDDVVWAFPQPEPDPYQLEWDRLVESILQDKPHNEVQRGAEASLVTSMGRMAAHTGQVITYDEMLNCEHEFGPTIDQLAMNSPAPLQADENGKYPVPMPGITTTREY